MRTTHSDLATLLQGLAAKLETVPVYYLVSDPSTLRLVTDAARILIEQDNQIAEMTAGLRELGRPARKYLAVKS
jgi:hypothetical protein